MVVRLAAAPGTSLQRMDAITAQAVEELRSLPGIEDVGAHVGRAVQSDQIVNVNSAEVWVSVDGSADYDDTIAAIESVAGGLPDVTNDVLTYSEQRITDVLGRGRRRDRRPGLRPEPGCLARPRQRKSVRPSPGSTGSRTPRPNFPRRSPRSRWSPTSREAESVGLAPGDVRRAATTLLSGLVVGNLFEEQKVFDVAVWGAPEIREERSRRREPADRHAGRWSRAPRPDRRRSHRAERGGDPTRVGRVLRRRRRRGLRARRGCRGGRRRGGPRRRSRSRSSTTPRCWVGSRRMPRHARA